MDYFGILERAFAITRRYRALWVFGFLLALFGAGGSTGNGVQYSFQGGDFDRFNIPPSIGIAVILGLVFVAVGLAIIAAIVNYVSRTALIDLVGEIEEGAEPTVRHGFDVGWSRNALRLFGVDVAIFVPLFLIIAFLVVIFAVPFVVLVDQGDPGPAIFLLVCCLVIGGVLFVILAVALNALQYFFHRQVVLAGQGVFDAIRHGYRLVRANLGQVVAMWLIMLVIGIVWAAVNFVIGLVAFAVVGGPAALMYGLFNSGLAAALGALPFLLVALLLFAVINALYTVFTSAVWTLTYLELPNRPAGTTPQPTTPS